METETARGLLFGSHKLLGRAVTAPPLRLFCILSGLSLLLYIPAIILRIASIPLTNDGNVGLLYAFTWVAPYALIFPVIFAAFSILSRLICSRLRDVLLSGVIKKNDSNTDPAVFFADLARRTQSGARLIPIVSLVFAIAFVANDTAHIFRAVSFLNREQSYQKSHAKDRPYEFLDWTFAYAIPEHPETGVPPPSWRAPSKPANLAFDLLAWYGFELSYTFLAFLWVLTYGWFLKSFADILICDDSGYGFYPVTVFADLRLGLHPLGTLYNLYLVNVVLFGLLGIWLRVKYIRIDCAADFSGKSYVGTVIDWIGEQVRNHHMALPTTRLLAFQCMNAGHIWMIAFYCVCVFIIIYFPIIRLKRYIKNKVFQMKVDRTAELEKAEAGGDEAKAKTIRKQIRNLESAQVWPNGDATGQAFLVLMLCILVTTISPALVGVGIVVLIITGAWKGIPKMFSRKDNADSN
jgi:hypothetical protein